MEKNLVKTEVKVFVEDGKREVYTGKLHVDAIRKAMEKLGGKFQVEYTPDNRSGFCKAALFNNPSILKAGSKPLFDAAKVKATLQTGKYDNLPKTFKYEYDSIETFHALSLSVLNADLVPGRWPIPEKIGKDAPEVLKHRNWKYFEQLAQAGKILLTTNPVEIAAEVEYYKEAVQTLGKKTGAIKVKAEKKEVAKETAPAK